MTFADGIFGCDYPPVTIKCTWDAQGQVQANPPDTASPRPCWHKRFRRERAQHQQLREVHGELA